MNSYRHLVIVDLTSYGSALLLINEFCDDVDVKVFEVSPLGSASLLILATQEAMAAQVLKNQILSQHTSSVLNLTLIENAHEDLLKTYLSQKQAAVAKNILVIESSFVSEALSKADRLLKASIALLDFRVVRAFPSNSILTITSDQSDVLLNIAKESYGFKTTVIANVQPTLKNYFQILT